MTTLVKWSPSDPGTLFPEAPKHNDHVTFVDGTLRLVIGRRWVPHVVIIEGTPTLTWDIELQWKDITP